MPVLRHPLPLQGRAAQEPALIRVDRASSGDARRSRARVRVPRASQAALRSALVVAPSWIGDLVAAQPLLRRLHEKHPGLAIDLLAPAWVGALASRIAEVRDVIDNPLRHGELNLAARWRLARRLAARHYDAAIVLPNSWKSALIPALAGIALRIGYTGEARYGLINRRHTLDANANPRIAERYAQLAEAPGTPLPRPLPQPRLVSDAARSAATAARFGLGADAAPVALCPGAEYGPAKRWPIDHWAELAQRLASRGHAIWLIGSDKDAAAGEEIARAAVAGCRNLCGRTTLDEAIDLIGAAHFVVTNDSGLMHVAAALDRPMIALFGSSSPRFTPPLSRNADVIWLELECSPCFERVCPLGHFDCMRGIDARQVEARMLAHPAP